MEPPTFLHFRTQPTAKTTFPKRLRTQGGPLLVCDKATEGPLRLPLLSHKCSTVLFGPTDHSADCLLTRLITFGQGPHTSIGLGWASLNHFRRLWGTGAVSLCPELAWGDQGRWTVSQSVSLMKKVLGCGLRMGSLVA